MTAFARHVMLVLGLRWEPAKPQLPAPPPGKRPACAKGHLWMPETTRIGSDGKRDCRICDRERAARAWRAKKAARALASEKEGAPF